MSSPFAMQRLSTADVPYRERMEFLHDFIGRHVGGQRFRLLDRNEERIDIAMMPLPGNLRVGQVGFPPIEGMRTRDLLGDGREHYMLTYHHADFEVSIEGKGMIKVPAGGMTMTSEAVHSEYRYASGARADVLMLDPRKLAALVPYVELEALYVLPPTAEGIPILKAYADTLRSNATVSVRGGELASRHIYDLAALVLEGSVHGGIERNERSIAAARLKLIKKDILERLADPELQVDAVAQRQGVTPRYVQRLFEMEETTFTEFVRNRRLEQAFRLLREGSGRWGTIANIASEVGFIDLSTFNRAFRKRFNATPSDVRAASLTK